MSPWKLRVYSQTDSSQNRQGNHIGHLEKPWILCIVFSFATKNLPLLCLFVVGPVI